MASNHAYRWTTESQLDDLGPRDKTARRVGIEGVNGLFCREQLQATTIGMMSLRF